MPHPNAKLSLAERFWLHVAIVNDETSCWLWLGANDGNRGYGRIVIPGTKKQASAHTIAWKVTYGEIPHQLFVLHKCDVKLCCRTDGDRSHLYLGTHQDNMRDSRERGTHPSGLRNGKATHPESTLYGENHPASRFRNEQYHEIRALYATGQWTLTMLAARYGVTKQAIFYIVKRQDPSKL